MSFKTNYGRDPYKNATALIDDCVSGYEAEARELESDAARLMSEYNRLIAKAYELRRSAQSIRFEPLPNSLVRDAAKAEAAR